MALNVRSLLGRMQRLDISNGRSLSMTEASLHESDPLLEALASTQSAAAVLSTWPSGRGHQ